MIEAKYENGQCRACQGPLGIIEEEVHRQKVKCAHCGDTYWRCTDCMQPVAGDIQEHRENVCHPCVPDDLNEQVPDKNPGSMEQPLQGWSECHCVCHDDPNVMHCVPCCSGFCSGCGKNILGSMEAHNRDCHPALPQQPAGDDCAQCAKGSVKPWPHPGFGAGQPPQAEKPEPGSESEDDFTQHTGIPTGQR